MVQPESLRLLLCPTCGWWHLNRLSSVIPDGEGKPIIANWWELHHAVLTEIDLRAADLSTEDLRRHLARHWNDRKHLTAQGAEDVVAEVLRDHYGGDIQRFSANAYTRDGGIDLVIASKEGAIQRVVQVKRRLTEDPESVRDVRDFIGAMVLDGADKGVFVTTASRFTTPAAAISKNLNLGKHKIELELVDGERLLELLDFTTRQQEVLLPPLVALDQEWFGERGEKLSTRQLLFGDLRKLDVTG